MKMSQFTYALYELKCITNLKTALIAYYGYAYASKLRLVSMGNSSQVNDLLIYTTEEMCTYPQAYQTDGIMYITL